MPKGKMPSSSRFWCVTINNYSEDELQEVYRLVGDMDLVTYAIIAKEIGKQGTPHLQAYIEWRKAKGIMAIKELGESFRRAHLEVRRGTRHQAISYCKKDSDYREFGEEATEDAFSQKMSKEELRQLCLEGGSRAVARDPRATLNNIKTARALLEEIEPARNAEEPIKVIWYYGATGIGKSRRARYEAIDKFGEDEVYRKAEMSKWFNGYDRHKAVIIDDYRDSWWPFTEILRLLDRYPTQVEIKGGMRQWVPECIWVTSSMSPREMYKGVGEDIQQLVRRCTKIEEMVFPWGPPQDSDTETIPCNELGKPLSRSSSTTSI